MIGTKKRKYKSCNNCNENDDYDDMVRCDHCKEWYHFQCAAVGPRIANLDWCCQACLKQFTETYQQAKAAEDSIVRNLELKKRKQNKEQVLDVNVDSRTEPSDEIEKMISKKVVETFSLFFKGFSVNEGTVVVAPETVAAVIETSEPTSVEAEIDAVDFGDHEEVGAVGDVGGTVCGGTDSGDVARGICGEVDIVCEFSNVSIVGTVVVADADATQTVATETVAAVIETAQSVPVTVEIDAVEYGDYGEGVVRYIDDIGGGACGGTDGDDIAIADVIDGADACTNTILPIKFYDDIPKFEFELEEKLDYFNQKFKNKGDKNLATAMRNISNRIIDDSVLRDFSYDGKKRGKKGKKPFKVYKNIIKLIVQSTMDAYNDHNSDKVGFEKKTYNEVQTFFKDNFLKFANQRSQRK